MLINNIRKSPTCPIRNTIHAPTRGATSAVAWKWKLHIISIHAPTRGATMIIWIKSAALRNTIHAPTRGATGLKIPASHVYKFQSTLLQEERRGRSCKAVKGSHISIHAPTRGATAKMHNIPYASLQ